MWESMMLLRHAALNELGDEILERLSFGLECNQGNYLIAV